MPDDGTRRKAEPQAGAGYPRPTARAHGSGGRLCLLRRQVVEQAISQLQQAASEAASALRRNLTCGVPSVEVRAALGVLEQSVKAVELLDLEERVQMLEELAAASAAATGR